MGEGLASSILDQIKLKEDVESLHSFCHEIFSSMSYINYNGIQISDSHIIKTILNVSLPVAERIFNSVNTEKWKDFIDFEQFCEIMVIIYLGNFTSKINFLFKILDYNNNKKIERENAKFFFSHFDPRSLSLVNDFFGDLQFLSYRDFSCKVQDNIDLVLFFYVVLYEKRTLCPEMFQFFKKFSKNSKKYKNLQKIAPKGNNKRYSKVSLSQKKLLSIQPFYPIENVKCNSSKSLSLVDTETKPPSEKYKDILVNDNISYSISISFAAFLSTNFNINCTKKIEHYTMNSSNCSDSNSDLEELETFEKDIQQSMKLLLDQEKNGIPHSLTRIDSKLSTNNQSFFSNSHSRNYCSTNYKSTSSGCIVASCSFCKLHSLNITPSESFFENEQIKNHKYEIDSYPYLTEYNIYSFNYGPGILSEIHNWCFFNFHKENKQKSKVFCLFIDKTFIRNEDNTTLSIIIPIGKGISFSFQFNSLKAKLNFFDNIGFNHLFLDDYTFIRQISKGAFGSIYLVTKDEKDYSMKIIKKKQNIYKQLQREIYINEFLSTHKHKNIIDIYEVYETGDTVYIVMEYIDEKINHMYNNYKYPSIIDNEVRKVNYIKQVIEGVGFLHKHGIVHRDIKFENILIDKIEDFTIKIIDFGLSVFLCKGEQAKEGCGTLIYSSPEIVLQVPYNYQVDLWSIGIISYVLNYNTFPITHFKEKEYLSNLSLLQQNLDKISPYEWETNVLLSIMKDTLIKSPVLRKHCDLLLKKCNCEH